MPKKIKKMHCLNYCWNLFRFLTGCLILLLGGLFSAFALANQTAHLSHQPSHRPATGIIHPAKTVVVKNGDQISVVFSDVDVNRLAVKNDKIAAIHGPSQTFSAKNAASGATFLTLTQQRPFTLFVSTEQGHHFSLFITPKAVIGRDLMLSMTDSGKSVQLPPPSNYDAHLIALMKAMIHRHIPNGYVYTKIPNAHWQNFYGIANLTPVAVFEGVHLTGFVYVIQNKTHHRISLFERYFYKKGVLSVALSTQTLKPLETGIVYEIVRVGQ